MDRSVPGGTGRQLVIVALPSEGDYVRKISSEKEPHLTLLYLGENDFDPPQIDLIAGYVEHAASLMSPFMLGVERRGELGDKKADVLFFNKNWSKDIEQFRSQLLGNHLVSEAYLSAEQFPEWVPHLTMGYPDTPAKADPRDDPGFWYVNFDRIALWTDDYEGPTFLLDHRDYDMEVAMSQIDRGRTAMSGILSHYGVKGMKWGVRRSDAQLDAASQGPKPRLSEDAKTATKTQDKIDRGGTGTVSNQELRGYLERMDLERRYHNTMRDPEGQAAIDRGLQSAQKVLKVGKTVEDVRKFLQTPTGQAVKTGFMTAATAAAAYATGGASAAAGAGASVVLRSRLNGG